MTNYLNTIPVDTGICGTIVFKNAEINFKELRRTQNQPYTLSHRNIARDHQQPAAIKQGGVRDRKYTTLPREGLPDPFDSISKMTRKKIIYLNTPAAITDEFIHEALMEIMCDMY